jgi:transposase
MDAINRKPYPSDLTDAEWSLIEPLLPPPVPAGAPRRVNFREIINEESCIWRAVAQATPHLRPSPALQIQSR